MIIPKTLLACCAHDPRRSAMNHVYVDCEKKHAVATDGTRIIVLNILPEPEDVSGYVPAMAIEYASKHTKGHLTHKADVTLAGEASFLNPFAAEATQPRYPDYAAVLPTRYTRLLCLDVNLLLDLAKALCQPQGSKTRHPLIVTLTWDGTHENGPLLVRDSAQADRMESYAALMPHTSTIAQTLSRAARSAIYTECMESIACAERATSTTPAHHCEAV